MDESYIGDSYDLVKRFFCQALGPIAPLYAHPQFVPLAIREAYVAATTIPILGTRPENGFGILLDPDKGVCMGRATRKHASLSLISEVNRGLCPKYIVCFDQSFDRNRDRREQMRAKGKILRGEGLWSLYYVSHASFLLAAKGAEALEVIAGALRSAGIPSSRLEGPWL
ncbi:MAG: hypothetical protein WA252_14455 [Candidatus Sulfotelmatobacter sp.]